MNFRTALKAFWGALHTRNYNAASASPRLPAWATMPSPASATLAAAPLISSRAAFAVSNIPYAASVVSVWCDNCITDAPAVQITPRDRATEQAFQIFLASILHSLRLMERSRFVTGEGLGLLRHGRAGEVRLQVLNPECLDRSKNGDLADGSRIINGVHHDAQDEIVGYWLSDNQPDLPFAVVDPSRFFPVEDVLHLIDRKIPGQTRGISELTPALARLNELEKLIGALEARASTAALFGGFITDATGTGVSDADTTRAPEADLSLEPGALRILPMGTSVSFADVPDAGDAIGLVKLLQRDVAAAVGVPHILAAADLGDVNYSSGKTGIEQFRRRLNSYRAGTLVPQVLEKIYRRWSLLRVLTGQPASMGSITFVWPAFPSLDPKKEMEADALAIATGVKSRAQVVAEKGRDVQDVDQEIAADKFEPKATPKAGQTSEKENAD